MPTADPTYGQADAPDQHRYPVLPYGQTPCFFAGPPTWRNGREAGAHLAGIVLVIPEKHAHVTVPSDYADGAVLAMVAGGLQVEAFSEGDGKRTFAVRSAYVSWDGDPA